MDSAGRLLIAILADAILGDPRRLPHPVRLIGLYISICDKYLRKLLLKHLFIAGAITGLTSILFTFLAVAASIKIAYGFGSIAGCFLDIVWIWLGLSAGDLDKSVRSVLSALNSGDFLRARKRLSMIVGRDTAHLNESEICRAAVETTAESLVDGIISPLFFYIIGGAPLMWAFKAASTCDSMIGHKDKRYILFGKFSARLDDAANFIPARISLAIIALSALVLRFGSKRLNAVGCIKICLRDSSKHASPNAGIPESAFAGALGVRLGGVNYYDSERCELPVIFQEGRVPYPEAARSGLALMRLSFIFASCAAFLILKMSHGPLLSTFFIF